MELSHLEFDEWALLFFCVAPFVSVICSPLAFKRLEAGKEAGNEADREAAQAQLAQQQQRASDVGADLLERVSILQSAHKQSTHAVELELRSLRDEVRSLGSDLADLRELAQPKPDAELARAPAAAKPAADVGRARSPGPRAFTRPSISTSFSGRGATASTSGSLRGARANSPARNWSKTNDSGPR